MRGFFLLCLLFFASAWANHQEIYFVTSDYQEIEVFLWLGEDEPSGLIVVLHGAGSDGIGLHSFEEDDLCCLVEKGYAVGMVSSPGFGHSEGVKDFCGLTTLSALSDCIDAMLDESGCGSYGIIGFGQGGLAGSLLATKRDDMQFVVSCNGVYDMSQHWDEGNTIRQRLVEKEYDVSFDQDSMIERSVSANANAIASPLYLIHHSDHPIVLQDEVSTFEAKMIRLGKEITVDLLPALEGRGEDKISWAEMMESAGSWIDTKMLY